jgi:hypothetical protein
LKSRKSETCPIDRRAEAIPGLLRRPIPNAARSVPVC